MWLFQTENAQEILVFFGMSTNSRTDVEGKGEVHPKKGDEGLEVEQVYNSTLSLTSALDEAGWSMPCPGHFTSGKDQVPIVQDARWAPGLVWMGAEKLPPTRIRSLDHSAYTK